MGSRRNRVEMDCQSCGKRFDAVVSSVTGAKRHGYDRKYCSRECYFQAKRIDHPVSTCVECGAETPRKKIITRAGTNGGYLKPTKFCSAECRLVASERASGFIDKNGYRIVRRNGIDAPEHRIVMESMIGRSLRADETVHHKNCDRADNRPGNLELWSSRHGKGQRVEDKVEFCRTFLRDYGRVLATFTPSEAIAGLMACI